MKIKALLYCTKAKKQKDLLWSNNLKHFFLDGAYNRLIDDLPDYLLNGKIVAECDFEVEEITLKFDDYEVWIESNTDENVILKKSCLDDVELYNYLGGGNGDRGYAIHIKNLNIFDEPRFIQDYSKNENPYNYIENAPSNMMYAYDVKSFNNFEKKILISIKPQEMCRIANKEQTVLVRKRVLKEMK